VIDSNSALAPLLLVAGLLLTVAAWLAGPPLATAWRRARVRAQPFPAAWREILRRRMPAFARLPAHHQLRLKKHIQVLLAEKPVIGCAGFEVDDEVRVLIAAQAALLLLGRRTALFSQLRQVLVYPGAFVVDRVASEAGGVIRDERRALAGESWQQGQVILSWDDVQRGAADPGDGQNVVIHEFAHQLDQENGAANGAPWLGGPDGARRRARWAAVMADEYQRLQQRLADGAPGLIDPYGATSPAEFFAVASELFFERPLALAEGHPRLYAELAGYYRVQPLSW
jgi:Mlc titration factor MtfA (ptsG expression regulator)